MAGTHLGAPSPEISTTAPRRTVRLVPGTTRTRRNHGVFLLGDELATVYSTRRELHGHGVILTVGNGALQLSGGMTPAQARGLARALAAAADAVTQLQSGGQQ